MTASNKSVRKNTVSSRKLEANYALHYTDSNAASKLAELKASNDSCGTCHYFQEQRCIIKNKPVMHYNICHFHKSNKASAP